MVQSVAELRGDAPGGLVGQFERLGQRTRSGCNLGFTSTAWIQRGGGTSQGRATNSAGRETSRRTRISSRAGRPGVRHGSAFAIGITMASDPIVALDCRRGRFAFSDSNLNVPILKYPTSRGSSRLSQMAKRSRSIRQLPRVDKILQADSEIKRSNTKSPAAIPPGSAWTTVSGQQRFPAKRRRPISCSGSAAQTSPSRDGIAIPLRR
jgi:hypothetical protein